MLLIRLVKQDINLSLSEAESLLSKGNLIEDKLLLQITHKSSNLYRRLAYSHSIDEVLFIVEEKDLKKSLIEYDWDSEIKGSFSVRCEGFSVSEERRLGGIIYDSLSSPKVSLKNPDINIMIYLIKKDNFLEANKVFVCRRIWEQKDDYESRKPHKRPELHPSGLHPRLAKAMINLTGIKKGTIVDPCCGSGGILIESLLMGFKTEGYDNDKKMISRARINLDSLDLNNYSLVLKDALTLKKRINYLVTDLPYARNTKNIDMDIFIEGFFKMLARVRIKKAVVAVSDSISDSFLDLNLKSNYLIKEKEFIYRLHKSLSKRIIVLSLNS